MSYSLHPAAEEEFTSAARYYATQASRRVGEAFITDFERAAELLQYNQQPGTSAREGLRILPLQRFPYSIIYRGSTGGPVIYAVAHHRREPGYWRDRT